MLPYQILFQITVTYSEPCQTSKMEHVAKKVKGLSLVSQNALRCLNGSEYSIELRTKINLP